MDALPTVRQISRARSRLEEAAKLCLTIEELDGFPITESIVDFKRKQLVRYLNYAAADLGMELRSRLTIVASNDEPCSAEGPR